MSVKTSNFGDLPRDGVGQPDPVVLPDPGTLFARRAERLRVLGVAHPMADWLGFLATVADAQAGAVAVAEAAWARPRSPRVMAGLGHDVNDEAVLHRSVHETDGAADAPHRPILDVATEPLGPAWPIALRHIAAIRADNLPDAARDILARLATIDSESLARDWLAGTLPAEHAGEAVFIAAALQVVFSLKAAELDVSTVHLLPQRNLCPVCASAPVAGVITAAGRTPGLRYLHCGLCATAWNHVRAVCTGCGESKGLTLQEVEGGTGAIKAEACGVCHGYSKVLYQDKDMAVEPMADDLASLGLDLMVSEAGWSRLAANPLIGGVG